MLTIRSRFSFFVSAHFNFRYPLKAYLIQQSNIRKPDLIKQFNSFIKHLPFFHATVEARRVKASNITTDFYLTILFFCCHGDLLRHMSTHEHSSSGLSTLCNCDDLCTFHLMSIPQFKYMTFQIF